MRTSNKFLFKLSPLTKAIHFSMAAMLMVPFVQANADPVNLKVDNEDKVFTEDLTYLTENVGLGNSVYSSFRVVGKSNIDIQSQNAYFTAHNTADEQGKGNYTAFASKIDIGYGNTVKFTGGDVIFNAISGYGAQGYANVSSSNEGSAYSLIFDNEGDLNITAVVEGNGVATSNAIGFMGNWQNLTITDRVQNVNVNVYGSGRFTGNALNSNGTSGLFFAGDTVNIDAANLNVNVISGQDSSVLLKTGADSTLQADVKFDAEAAKELGTSYSITYGLNNKGNTTIGKNTTTTINVSDDFWNAVGISNDPMYLDQDSGGQYSNYNLSNLSILGDLVVNVKGSSIGAEAGDQYKEMTEVPRLSSTYGLYANVTSIEGVKGYDDQLSVVKLGSAGKNVSFFVSNDTEGANDDTFGIYGNKAQISLEGSQTLIDVDSKTDGTVYGAKIENGTTLTFNAEKTVINVSGQNTVAISVDEDSNVSGSVMTFATSADSAASKVIFKGENVGIDAQGENSTAIQMGDTATVEFLGNATLQATNAIVASEGAILSVTGTESAQASLTAQGKVQNKGTTTLTQATYALNVGGSSLGKVQANNSTVALATGSYTVDQFSGKEKTLLLTDLKDTAVTIVSKQGDMTLATTGEANDQFADAQSTANALTEAVTINSNDKEAVDVLEIQAGAVNDALSATLNQDGTLSDVRITKNETLDALGSVTALSALSLRHEMNSLSKRMGELRDAPDGVGLWARGYGSEMEYGSQNVTAKSNSIQIGLDQSIGDWKVGLAFTYTDGEASYDHGSADNKGYGLALYGTWFVPCGAYLDLMAKYNRFENDFALNGMNGDYDSNAYAVSVETGYRFEFLQGGLYVEPQIGVNYGHVQGEQFKTSNGVSIDQGDYDSLIGRVGVRTGFKFPNNKGTIYARASGVYDFDGDMSAKAIKGVARNTIEEDLGGAWIEMGVGANFNWTDNTYTYIDFERTNGGEVKENYRWNIGVRHTF